MPTPSYIDEPLPDISGHWVCINHIAGRLLDGTCLGPDVICDLEEALCRGLLRSKLQIGCERRHVAPSEWADMFQLALLDSPEGWTVAIVMRNTGAFLAATCYLWQPDCDRLLAMERRDAPDTRRLEQSKTTTKPVKLPEWLEAVVPIFGGKAPYPSLGSLRDAIKSELDIQHRTYPRDRTIERILNKRCSSWFVIAKN